jgi:hypothetical protein
LDAGRRPAVRSRRARGGCVTGADLVDVAAGRVVGADLVDVAAGEFGGSNRGQGLAAASLALGRAPAST